MANEADEKPVYAWTAVTEEDAKGVFLTFVNMTVADFLAQARAAIKRGDTKNDEQKAEIGRQTVELQAKDETLKAREREIAALHKTITDKNGKIDELNGAQKPVNEALTAAETKLVELDAQVKTLTEKLALQKIAAGKAMPKGLERLENGGIRLPVSLDIDEAALLLSWAQDAGSRNDEEIAAYIRTQIHDALVAVTSS